ncbi:hypothetical protein [Levilactobacillus tujiorum]|uniref:hypothetical protein n=1 Tax=Levilactobacillus tujiorum TaxID=2912243 RepID=UPI0014573708|nr:hypothetical protein [Levilactobacillus tujiorum]
MINPNIHLASSSELDKIIKQRLVDRGYTAVQATELMIAYRELIASWKHDYTNPKCGSHQSASNIADDIILYEEFQH